MHSLRFRCLGLPILVLMLMGISEAQTVSTLHDFNGTDGATPYYVVLTQGRDGKLYGTTLAGGAFGLGTIFRQSTVAGQGAVLHDFSGFDGKQPYLSPILARDGNYYGGASLGGAYGYGLVFRMTSAGVVTAFYNFKGRLDASGPSTPTEGFDGNLYGTTFRAPGGSSPANVFKLTPSGSLSVIHSEGPLAGTMGTSPYQDSAGYLYVIMTGTSRFGSIVKLATSGLEMSAVPFDSCTRGCVPIYPPIEASDGNFYGTTSEGGTYGAGVLYEIDGKTGAYTVLHEFGGLGDGTSPYAGVTQGTDGNFYGATYGGGSDNGGTLFQFTSAGAYAQLHSFPKGPNSAAQGALAAPMQHTNGKFYGTTSVGSNGNGSIYSLDMGLGPFVTFVRAQGKVAAVAQILGQGLTGTTSVTFNGVPAASFSVVSDTYMTAVVPSAATTGPMVVTTPTGPLTSNVNFRIAK